MKTTSIEHEFQNIELGDKRLNDRAEALLATLAANPTASINEACQGWGETKAAYRLFDNPNVQPQDILQAHSDKTLERINAQPTVCIAQDTTDLDYTAHPPDDIRNLDRLGRRGLYDHSQIAFTPEKLCLGVVDVKFWDRDKASLGTSDERKGQRLETGEGQRWLDGYRKACQIAGKCPDTQIVSLSDREGDLYEIFVEAEGHDTPAEFVIRSQRKRSLPVDTIAQSLRIVDLYVARWPIEVYFGVFKTGCRVEEIQLEKKDRLIRCLMFYKVIAWRIMFVTFLGRACPGLPCDVVFSEAEWKSVWKVVEKEEPPSTAPPLSISIPILATLGGYNARPSDGPPGAEVIWRGTKRMLDFAICWQAFGPEQ